MTEAPRARAGNRTYTGPFRLLNARRALHRASRMDAQGRASEALPLLRIGAATLRDIAKGNPKRQHEHVASLILLADWHLTRAAPSDALLAQEELVTILETTPCTHERPDEAADRLADALTRRADTHRLLGNYDNAAADLHRALELATAPLTRAGAHNASGVLAKDTDRFDDAADHYARALHGMRAILGNDHPDQASLFHNLAGLAHSRGQHADGEPHARHAIALRERIFGPDSPEVAADLAVLGALLAGQGRHTEAEAIFQGTLATWTSHRGPGHYEVAVSLHHLGVLHAAAGNHDTAAAELTRALTITESTLGGNHPETRALRRDLTAVSNLATRNP